MSKLWFIKRNGLSNKVEYAGDAQVYMFGITVGLAEGGQVGYRGHFRGASTTVSVKEVDV